MLKYWRQHSTIRQASGTLILTRVLHDGYDRHRPCEIAHETIIRWRRVNYDTPQYQAGEERIATTVRESQRNPDQLIGILRSTIVSLVRRDGTDLSARQLGVFLTCYLTDQEHTVRGLAADLSVSKPAITRALDRLSEADYLRRKPDPRDRRSVLVQRTARGAAFLRDIKKILAAAEASASEGVKPPRKRG